MLEGLLKRAFATEPTLEAESAGTSEEPDGQPAHEHSIACMDERGIDIRSHRSRRVRRIDLTQFDLIVCAEPPQVEVVRSLCPTANVILGNGPEGISNPWEKGPDAYRSCAETMEKVTAEVVARLTELNRQR